MILACQNISKAFGTDEIIQHASFHIEENEKAAIVGINGAGKTTLLRIIMGELEADEGTVVLAKNRTIGYLPQNPDIAGNRTIYEEVLSARQEMVDMQEELIAMEQEMSRVTGEALERLMESYNRRNLEFEQKGGQSYKSEITGVLKGLGFTEEEFAKHMQELSGGQRTRVCLGKLLVTKPDVILLDEPTNHLDMASIAWLETFLLNYDGAVVIVAHDRYFLNRVVTKIIEIDNGLVMSFQGNYSDYAGKKSQLREAQMNAWLNQQKEIKHQEEVIAKLKSFNREKSIRRAESREKLLDKMEVLEKPMEVCSEMRIHLEPEIVSGNDVLTVEGLTKTIDGTKVLDNVSFIVGHDDKIAFVGGNELAKTTLFKILAGEMEPDSGSYKWGVTTSQSYFPKDNTEIFDTDLLIVDWLTQYSEIKDATYVRGFLGRMLFAGEDGTKKMRVLSGGEKVRVLLSRMMIMGSNILILDEPTDHLDMESITALNNGLIKFPGVVLFASRDHQVVQTTANRIIEFLPDGTFIDKVSTYDEYLENDELARKRQVYSMSADDESDN